MKQMTNKSVFSHTTQTNMNIILEYQKVHFSVLSNIKIIL